MGEVCAFLASQKLKFHSKYEATALEMADEEAHEQGQGV